uniref:Transducin/WD40 repeat-like superfamily protein n=1 Tax=Oryza meridionalis TaxID=40149 RepID=A0A0E0E6T1_9ORYZ
MAPPPPKELPGFYYDPDKNRYFPIRGPIPGASTRRPAPPPPAQPPPPQAAAAGCRKTARQPELVHAREMYGGGVIFSNKRKSTFMRQCQYAQASQPMVWKYKGTALVADKALEELHVTIQTPIGLKESKVLVTGNMNGTVRIWRIWWFYTYYGSV